MNEWSLLTKGSTENTASRPVSFHRSVSKHFLIHWKRSMWKRLCHNLWMEDVVSWWICHRGQRRLSQFLFDQPSEAPIVVLYWPWWPRWSSGVSMPTKGRSEGTQAKFRTVEHRLTAESWMPPSKQLGGSEALTCLYLNLPFFRNKRFQETPLKIA